MPNDDELFEHMRQVREQQEKLRRPCSLQSAINAGIAASFIGLLVFLVGPCAAMLWMALKNAAVLAIVCLFILMSAGISLGIAFYIGGLSGKIAHAWLAGSNMPIRLMAVAVALIADLTLAGWLLVFWMRARSV